MAIIDTDFQAWLEKMKNEVPSLLHGAMSDYARAVRMNISALAFAAGKKAGRQHSQYRLLMEAADTASRRSCASGGFNNIDEVIPFMLDEFARLEALQAATGGEG